MSQVARHVEPARALAAEIDAASNIISHLKELAAGDEDFLSDLIEGETSIFEIIARIDASEVEDQAEIAGIEAMVEKLEIRKARAAKRVETKRSLIAVALDQIGLRKHRTPLGTISVSDKPITAVVIEEADLPTRFWQSQAPKLDKTALNDAVRARRKALDSAAAIKDAAARRAALEEAERLFPPIPGATESNGGVKLSIRR